jgi:hypothetical protein
MKKSSYLLVLFFTIIATNTLFVSCKEAPDPELAELYPDWVNLTWVSTDGITEEEDPEISPRLNISIKDNHLIWDGTKYLECEWMNLHGWNEFIIFHYESNPNDVIKGCYNKFTDSLGVEMMEIIEDVNSDGDVQSDPVYVLRIN